jgi:O-antigen/teichoic acid export membrane protein
MYRRSLELLLVIAIPVSLMMGLAADFVIGTIFGRAFLPSIPALQVLAPMFVLTYVAMLSAMTLVLTGRGWTTTIISLSSIAANALLNVALLRPGHRWLGAGGGGTTAAAISVATELLVVVAMLGAIGGKVFDKRNVATIAKCLVGCAVAIAAHAMLARLGPLRLVVDAGAYAAIVIASGAVRPGELLHTLKDAWATRRARA